MGAARVGKSSLITQFLYSRFQPKYKRTIEEMHQGNFNVAGVGLTLDILDTSGTNEVFRAAVLLLILLLIFAAQLIYSIPCGCFNYDKFSCSRRLIFPHYLSTCPPNGLFTLQ